MAVNSDELSSLTNERDAYQWIKWKCLLKQNLVCESCKAPLELIIYEPHSIYEVRRCVQKNCGKRSRFVHGLAGSFFGYRGPSINLLRQIHLIKYFCDKKSCNEVESLLKIHSRTVCEAYKKCREFITMYLQKYPFEIGGEGVVVAVWLKQLDVADPKRRNWILMMVDTSKTPLIGLMIDLNSVDFNYLLHYLLQIIETVVQPRSIIASDIWGNSKQLHSNKFRICNCTDTERNIQKAYYDSHRDTFKIIEKVKTLKIQLFLNEDMWRERCKGDKFDEFIDHLTIFYNKESVLNALGF